MLGLSSAYFSGLSVAISCVGPDSSDGILDADPDP